MTQSYTASDIEVLSGLEPVRRRPGMYTHTQRPNHLAHEVIDNSVDEAIAGYCKQIDVTLFKRSEEHTSELQSRLHLVCRLLLEKKKKQRSSHMRVAYSLHDGYHPCRQHH